MLKKDKGKDKYPKRSNKCRKANIAWDSESEASRKSVYIDEEEVVNLCLMAHQKKKKNVSHSKYDHVDEMSYIELQKAFDTLHNEAKDDFK